MMNSDAAAQNFLPESLTHIWASPPKGRKTWMSPWSSEQVPNLRKYLPDGEPEYESGGAEF